MTRRAVILGLGSTAAWPLAAIGQQQAMPVIGFLAATSAHSHADRLNAYRAALRQFGYVEGENIQIEFRWAENRYDRLPELASDLVRRGVAAIIASGGAQTALAAKAATRTIPIIFMNGSDPVQLGLVVSLNRPAWNITGVTLLTVQVAQKRLELASQLVPSPAAIAWLTNPRNPNAESLKEEIAAAALSLGRNVQLVNVATDEDIDSAFRALVRTPVGVAVTSADPIFTEEGNRFIILAKHYALPMIYPYREHVLAGGLMSYGPSITDAYRQVGLYTAQILKGVDPGVLPVHQATKFELVINLKTAKALRLEIPPTLLARADEVIE